MRLIDADALIEFCAERWIPLNIDAVNMQPTIQPEKAQLSKEGTTKDAISRLAAIDAIISEPLYESGMKKRDADEVVPAIYEKIKSLPSARPEPHEGCWILHESPDGGEQYECSECGVLWKFNDGTPEDNEAFYCPKCGAKMKGVTT